MEKMEYPKISYIPEFSAIYFALLQCGYGYFSIERDKTHVEKIKSFAECKHKRSFFSNVEQDSCEVYPYWPRAFLLESAALFLNADHSGFADFGGFQKWLMGANSISDSEKTEEFWKWVKGFPAAIQEVFLDESFQSYLQWENQWISEQNEKYSSQLQQIAAFTEVCIRQYHSPVTRLQIVINPIKCVYASDYHIRGDVFTFSSGRFQMQSIIHEFLHHVVHPYILQYNDIIASKTIDHLNIDKSYYLSEDDIGKRNALEEYAVRALTADFMAQKYPDDLAHYLVSMD